jgi:hypothetical protein
VGKSNRNRCDASGRAFAGSQRQIQHYVNERQSVLNEAISNALSLRMSIRWASPLRSDRYREYKDSAFLRVLGLDGSRTELSHFWPRGGPVWDGLGIVSGAGPGVLLIEAKSHVPEISGGGCGAKADRSIKKIETSLAMTKLWLEVSSGANWKGELYQTANRLAHLYFFREVLHMNAWLVNVYFTADPHSPTSRAQWDVAVSNVKGAAGHFKDSVLCRCLPSCNLLTARRERTRDPSQRTLRISAEGLPRAKSARSRLLSASS